ncbi:Inner membrane protein YbhN [Stieleria neptunia]|uniref:Inner membrane protein YbhN n=1 Tax=Stieleria neptunia TaxID=2527979 RepID=A0A518HKH5_9BACT|nr:Inner membrane protein YbhN [Stieleria neptunia]
MVNHGVVLKRPTGTIRAWLISPKPAANATGRWPDATFPLLAFLPLPKKRIRKYAGPVLAIALFALAVRLLIREAHQITWDEFVRGLTGVPASQIVIAAFLIALNYGLLIAYDILALRYVARSLPLRRIALVSIAGFSLGNNLGTLLAAAPIRFRFYSQWGLPPGQIVALISVVGLTFWSGWWFLGGMVLIWVPIQLPPDVTLPFATQTLGVVLISLAILYSLVCFLWRKPWPIGELHLRPPRPGLMFVQASVAAVDLLISATALYLVLPGDSVVPFAQVLAAYLVAIGVAMMTQVPGGLGVLEVILLTLLKGTVGDTVLASVLIFRVLYYWLPLLAGMIALVGYEIFSGAVAAREATGIVIDPQRAADPAAMVGSAHSVDSGHGADSGGSGDQEILLPEFQDDNRPTGS